MKTSTLFSLFAVTLSNLYLTLAQDDSNVTQEIVNNAAADNIDFSSIGDIGGALTEISGLWNQITQNTTTTYSEYTSSNTDSSVKRRKRRFGHSTRGSSALLGNRPSLSQFLSGGTRIDVHSHVVPDWYRLLVPVTGGNPTPTWDMTSYMSFMDSEDIDRAVFSFSAPGANVFQGQRLATVALARLMNEQAAAYCAAFPNRLKFYAVVPLPYVQEAIIEAQYALTRLGAAGIFLTSNFEGTYLGDASFRPFFQAIDKMSGKKVLYIHPGTPYVKYNNHLIEANPTPYPTGNIEFYFETARTLMDLSLTQTIHNFTSINYIIPHVGGAFPAAIDRILKSAPTIYDSSLKIYQTRFWWDSAGPTYYHQVSGLLGYEVPKTQLVFGTDFPYAPGFTQPGSLNAVLSSTLLTDAERKALFATNTQNAFADVDK